jgi:DNA invertase Pin-like site-specific DNA recombinase
MVAAWAVDRLARSLTDLLSTPDTLKAANVDLFLYQQAVDVELQSPGQHPRPVTAPVA